MNHFAADTILVGEFSSSQGAVVEGKFQGTLLLGGPLKIEASGRVQGGRVEASGLTIEPGGNFRGSVKISDKTSPTFSGTSTPMAPTSTMSSMSRGWQELTKFALGQK